MEGGKNVMTAKRNKPSRTTSLYRKAEKLLFEHPERVSIESSIDTPRLVHELQVHQIELEMQNDEFRRNQVALEEARDRYLDLYDFAPIGYFTFDRKGRIMDVNLTGAHLLGPPRKRLVGMPFIIFVKKEDIALFHKYLTEVFSSDASRTCELRIKQHHKGPYVYVSLESVAVGRGEEVKCRSAVIDMTKRKLDGKEILKTREELAKANDRLRHLSTRLLTAQEEERRRIASEVHDSFSASLSAIRYELLSVLSKPEKNNILKDVLNELAIAISEAQRIQMSLRPSVLDDLGIVPALTWLCRDFQKTHSHIKVNKKFHSDGTQISQAIEIAMFRIAQEALNNIAKHSGADSVRFSLTQKNSSIEFVIRDNGQGFDVEKALSQKNSQRGLGLSSMKERALFSGGLFHIESTLGKGTVIRASWPLA